MPAGQLLRRGGLRCIVRPVLGGRLMDNGALGRVFWGSFGEVLVCNGYLEG